MKVKQFNGSILSQVGDGFDEKFDQEMNGQDGWFPGKVVVENFAIQLKP